MDKQLDTDKVYTLQMGMVVTSIGDIKPVEDLPDCKCDKYRKALEEVKGWLDYDDRTIWAIVKEALGEEDV